MLIPRSSTDILSKFELILCMVGVKINSTWICNQFDITCWENNLFLILKSCMIAPICGLSGGLFVFIIVPLIVFIICPPLAFLIFLFFITF